MALNDFLSFWQKNPLRNLWQHPLWHEFQQALGRQTWLLQTETASAVMVKHGLPFGFCWLEIPRGPLFEAGKPAESLLDEIMALAKRERAVFVRLSPYQPFPDARFSFLLSHYDHHPQTSLLLDLSKSGTELLKEMKPKGRYNLRLAEKNGVTVEPSQDLDAFYLLLQKTTSRDGFSANSKAYYQKMLQAFGSHAQLLLATKNGQVLAGGIFVYLDQAAIYYYGASDHAHRSLMAPYLLQWSAIQEAKRRSCKTYDFLGIAPENVADHPWAGVTEFKKKFGGQVVTYPPAQEITLRRFWHWVYRVYKRFK